MARNISFAFILALFACGSPQPTPTPHPVDPETPSVKDAPSRPGMVLESPSGTYYLPKKSTAAEIEPASLPNDVFAMINGKPLTTADIDSRLTRFPDIPPQQRDMARQRIGETLIAERLIDTSIRTGQIVVSPSDLEVSREKFEDMLEKNEMTHDTYVERMNLTEDQLQRMFTVEALFWSQVDEQRSRSEYEKIKDQLLEARTIQLILKGGRGVKEDEKPRLHEEINKIRDRALKGEDFTQLALETSDDPNVQQTEGRLGPVTKKSLREDLSAMSEAIFSLKNTGDISDIIETPLGYMLIKLVEVEPETITVQANPQSPPQTIPAKEYCDGMVYSKARSEFFKALFENNVVVRQPAPQQPGPGGMMPPGN